MNEILYSACIQPAAVQSAVHREWLSKACYHSNSNSVSWEIYRDYIPEPSHKGSYGAWGYPIKEVTGPGDIPQKRRFWDLGTSHQGGYRVWGIPPRRLRGPGTSHKRGHGAWWHPTKEVTGPGDIPSWRLRACGHPTKEVTGNGDIPPRRLRGLGISHQGGITGPRAIPSRRLYPGAHPTKEVISRSLSWAHPTKEVIGRPILIILRILKLRISLLSLISIRKI